jgi:hypothetical protein
MATPRPSIYPSNEDMRLRNDVDRLKAVVYGGEEYGTDGLLKNQSRITRSIENIYRVLIAIAVAVGLIFMIILVYWLQLWL